MSTNATCHMKEATQSPPPLIQNGKVVIQAHHIGWAVTGFFALASTVISAWLINKHLQWYTNKREQRYIVRILFMVPIYSIVSFASYLFWNQSTPLLLLRDCYEATVLTSFFYLLLMYLSPNPVEQKDIFRKVGLSKENDRDALRRGEPVKKWMFPLTFVTSKPGDGLYFLQIMKWAILQYCVIRPITTLAAVILNYLGLYCESSWSPGWGYVYITVVVSISVSVAMYCLIQVYVPVSSYLAPHRPLLKLFSVKAVVFLTFWQATFLSLLATFGLVKDTQYMTAEDINIGIGAILETVEMTFFACLHIKAFSYKPYCPDESTSAKGYPPRLERTLRLRSLGHALDFRETLREVWSGCVYILRRFRGQETDRGARRLAAREEVFGGRESGKGHIPRHSSKLGEELVLTEKHALSPELQGLKIAVDVKQEVHVDDELQWLGSGDDYIYGLGFSRRERSAGLEEQIQSELERRGLPRIMRDKSRAKAKSRRLREDTGLLLPEESRDSGHEKQRSWWRNVYDKISGTSRGEHSDNGLHDDADTEMAWMPSRRLPFKTKLTPNGEAVEVDAYMRIPTVESYDELLPPPRTLGDERSKRQSRTASNAARPRNALQMSLGTPTSGDGGHQLPSDTRHLKHKPLEKRDREQIYLHQPDLRLSPHVDHVLSRLFPSSPPKSDAGTSTSASIALSTNPSSQTHSDSDRRYLRLVPPAHIVPKGSIALRTPIVVHGEGYSHLRVEGTRRERERSRTAVVEGIDSESTARHDLSHPHEETRIIDGEVPSVLVTTLSPPVILPALAHKSAGCSLRHDLGPGPSLRGPRVPKPKVVLPAPLAVGPSTTDSDNTRSQQDVTTTTTSTGTGTSRLPEIRISVAPPARRKAVPQYHETNLPNAFNNDLKEIQANLSVRARSISSLMEDSAPDVGSQASVAELGHLKTAGTRQQQQQQRASTLTSVHEEMCTGTTGAPPRRMSSPSGIPDILTTDSSSVALRSRLLTRDSPSSAISQDASLQRRGAQAVRRSSAPPPPRGSLAADKFSNRPLVSGPTAEMQRARHPKYRSPHRLSFSRHNVTGHPITEESFGADYLSNTRRMSVPVGPSTSQSRRITDPHVILLNDAHDVYDFMTHTNFDETG